MKEQRKKIIKNKLHQDLGRELDMELAWSEFKQKKRKKRLVLWWQTLGLLLLIVGFLFMNIWTRPTAAKKQISELAAAKKSIAVTKSPFSIHPNKERVKNKPTETEIRIEERASVEIKNNTTNIEDQKTQKLDEVDLNTIAHPSQKIPDSTIPIPKNRIKRAKTIDNRLFVKRATKSLSKIDETHKQLLDIPLHNTEKNPQLLLEVRLLSTPLPLLKLKAAELPPLSISKAPSAKLWEWGFAYQYAMIGRKIKGENTDYLNRRNTMEDFLEANHLNLRLRRYLKDHFFLESGIHIGRYRAKLVDQYQIFEQKVFENEVVEIIQTGLQEERIFGRVEGTQTLIHTNTRFQEYLEISVPIQLGWQFPLTKTLSIDGMAGVRYSIWNKNDGYTYESATSIGTYQPLGELGYKKAGVITAVSSLLLNKKIGRGTKISTGIQVHHDLTNRWSNKSERDKFYGYGLQVGLLKQLAF